MFDDKSGYFNWKSFDELAPRLLTLDYFKDWLVEYSKYELDETILEEEMDTYSDLLEERRSDILRVMYSVIANEIGQEEVAQSWDGDASGCVRVYSYPGFFYLICTDRGIGGPCGSISEAFGHDFFEGYLTNPEIVAKNLPKEQLDRLVDLTVDWDNEGSDIYINGERYEVIEKKLQLANGKNQKD